MTITVRNRITFEQAQAAGYCIVSNRFRMAARLDRPDWKSHMATTQPDGHAWVRALGDRQAADYYRRCLSEDTITVPDSWVKTLGNSNGGPSDYRTILS